MQVIAAHRKKVARLEKAFARLMELEHLLHDTRSESWDLQTHYSAESQIKMVEVRQRVDAYEEEIHDLTETLRAPGPPVVPPSAPGAAGAPPAA